MLIEAGANVNHLNKYNYSTLMFASYKNHPDIVKLLLNVGANVNIADEDGNTALFEACLQNNVKIVCILIDAEQM